jgi:hypothetical protein
MTMLDWAGFGLALAAPVALLGGWVRLHLMRAALAGALDDDPGQGGARRQSGRVVRRRRKTQEAMA